MNITQEQLNEILKKHKKWLKDEEGGERAYLSHADLSHADLNDVNMDFSVLPLWCGSLSANFDDKIIIQIIYHAVKAGLNSRNTTDEVKAELRKVINLANKFHRVNGCGKIE